MPLYRALHTWEILAHSAVPVSHTGNTDVTTLATVTIPAGRLGLNGCFRLTSIWSYTNSGNAKNLGASFGGSSIWGVGATTTAGLKDQRQVSNRNSASSQLVHAGAGQGGWATAGTGPSGIAINTANASDIILTAQLASAGETVTLESYLVELLSR